MNMSLDLNVIIVINAYTDLSTRSRGRVTGFICYRLNFVQNVQEILAMPGKPVIEQVSEEQMIIQLIKTH